MCHHTPVCVITPPCVLSHPRVCYHTPVCAITPPCVLSHPRVCYHTPVRAITPPWVLSHPRACYHTPVCAITPLCVLPHPPCYGETRLRNSSQGVCYLFKLLLILLVIACYTVVRCWRKEVSWFHWERIRLGVGKCPCRGAPLHSLWRLLQGATEAMFAGFFTRSPAFRTRGCAMRNSLLRRARGPGEQTSPVPGRRHCTVKICLESGLCGRARQGLFYPKYTTTSIGGGQPRAQAAVSEHLWYWQYMHACMHFKLRFTGCVSIKLRVSIRKSRVCRQRRAKTPPS